MKDHIITGLGILIGSYFKNDSIPTMWNIIFSGDDWRVNFWGFIYAIQNFVVVNHR